MRGREDAWRRKGEGKGINFGKEGSEGKGMND